MRRCCEPRVGRVARRVLGATLARAISSSRRASASRRLPSWVRWLRALISSAPSVLRRRPASERSRALTAAAQCQRARQVEAQLRGGGDLVDVLSARSRGAHELELQILLRDGGSLFTARRSPPLAHCGRCIGRCGAIHVHLALRDRDGDAGVAEQAPDQAIDVGAHVVDAAFRIGDPEAQLQIHAVVGELHQA